MESGRIVAGRAGVRATRRRTSGYVLQARSCFTALFYQPSMNSIRGLSLYAKRIRPGKVPSGRRAKEGVVSISAAQMAYMLEGIDWRNRN